jgi:hypothetical protein
MKPHEASRLRDVENCLEHEIEVVRPRLTAEAALDVLISAELAGNQRDASQQNARAWLEAGDTFRDGARMSWR